MDDIELIDEFMKEAPPSVKAAWGRVVRMARRGKRISSSTLPAIGKAAQLVVQARDHLNTAIEEMSDAVTPSENEKTPDEEGRR
jgi:hypothetical protein